MRNLLFLVFSIILLGCNKSNPEPVINGPISVEKDFTIIYDNFEDQDVVIIGSKGFNLIVSFFNEVNGQKRNFIPAQSELPVIMHDDEGNSYDVFGDIVAGPDAGQRLIPTNSCMGYWLSFSSMFPGADIYDSEVLNVDLGLTTIPGWLIPKTHVYQGAGFDAIKSIEDPKFIEYSLKFYPDDRFYVKNEDLVIGVKAGEEIRAYPHRILDQHEVVNDQVGSHKYSVIYCPLTGTASVWDRMLEGGETTFGVSGFLHTSNIIPFDRSSKSLWSQLQAVCINGNKIGEKVERYSFVETTFETWNLIYNTPLIMSEETGVDRNYREYPYGSYRTDPNTLIYPIQYDDQRLNKKERVHGIVSNGKAKVYRFTDF